MTSKPEIPKILVVNDDAGSLMALVGLLTSWESEFSYEVLTAQSGEEALRHVLTNDFAVILLDVNMPGMDGFETAEAIHLRPRSSSIPIIFVTAYLADELNRFKGYQKGAVDYLFTPIIPQILKAKLSVFVGLSKKNIELRIQADALDRRTKELVAINSRLETEINERRIAEQQNKTKDDFLAMLGHELRNPLSAITGAAALMNMPNVSVDAIENAKCIIQRQSRHLSHIVDDLLDLSRVMSGKVMLDKRPLEISGLIKSCIETLAVTGRTSEYVIDFTGEAAWVNADATRLEQVITNVLDNAIKYTPSGGKIAIKACSKNDEVEVSVSDSGMGMSADLLSQAFEVFVQGERTPDRSQGGLGIGLALVRQLIAMHDGTVTATSEGKGHGSTFVLKLPASSKSVVESKPAINGQSNNVYDVLLIEDNDDAREMTAMVLECHGHTVFKAADGVDGIRIAGQNKPDVIVIDIGLPGIDGHEVARRLKSAADTQKIPLIALTGYGLPHDRQAALEAGFNMHLVKPVNADALLKAIELCVPTCVAIN